MSFSWTAKQLEAQNVLAGDATHILLEGGSRCVAGSTILDGQIKTIKELAEIGYPVTVLTSRGWREAEAPFRKGVCRLLRFQMESGKTVEVTPDHRFWNGNQWVRAENFCAGSYVAALSSETSPLASNLAPFPSGFLSGVRSLMRKLVDFQASCFLCFRRCDPLPHQAEAFDQACHASQFCGQGHSQRGRIHSCHVSQSPVLDSHVQCPQKHVAGCTQSGQALSLPSSLGDSPMLHQPVELAYSGAWQKVEFSPCQHQRNLLSVAWSCLHRSFEEAADSVLYRFCEVLGLSYDIPIKGGYSLEKVLSVTETTQQDYYTLHVPVDEQYFANGILHHNSGKTFLIVRSIVMRALKAPGSRHAILRYRFSHVKQSIVLDTFPAVMAKCFPEIQYSIDKTDWYAKLPGGSEIWFGGLDDKARVEKILGKEFVTIFLNEVSQIPFSSREMVVTRLAQLVNQVIQGKTPTPLKPRIFYDWNPTNKAHWAHKLFKLLTDPDTGKALSNPQDYAHFKINPKDNVDNLSEGYMSVLNNMSARMRKRFRDGDAADATPNALFSDVDIEKWRVTDEPLPEMVRMVVGVDPSGADETENSDNDAIGIVCGGLGVDGNAYLFEDATVKAGPATWGKVAVMSFDRHEADVIVGEQNYGGAMVKFVIQTARPRIPYKVVTATRGKHVRAEPFSALYEQGKVRHVGNFHELEEELCSFSTAGYTGENSPNRADAWIWVLTELFAGIIKEKKLPPKGGGAKSGSGSWMSN